MMKKIKKNLEKNQRLKIIELNYQNKNINKNAYWKNKRNKKEENNQK